MIETSDIKIPLELNVDNDFWTLQLIEEEWVKLLKLQGRDGNKYININKSSYHIEKDSPNNLFKVYWTSKEKKPLNIYAHILIKPKPSGIFLGMPLSIFIPIVTALAGALAAIMVHYVTVGKKPDCSPDKICKESTQWVSKKDLDDNKNKLKKAQKKLNMLSVCENNEKMLHTLSQENDSITDKINYVLGYSHGLRLELFKHMFSADGRYIAVETENSYMENLLSQDITANMFIKGTANGSTESLRIINLGKTNFLTGQEVQNGE